ncbi:MAG: glycosyltransferase family 39 protein, partial [Candidatus Promineifilaceae bacterium]|nr:glycosyltransferase family 39 protein [Candidatus Promineifilaceae bacterium]
MAEATVTREIEERKERRASGLSVAGGLLLLVGALAAVLRLANLNAIPLAPGEAQEALAVWRFWQPESSGPAFDYSPAYFSLTSLLMLVLGDGEAVMRVVPAVFGVALPLLPWFWRRYLGVVGALTASLLLAVSPIATITARTAGGAAIALTAVLLVLIAWTRYLDEGRRGWLVAVFGALGLGLASGPLFLSGLATAGLAWLAQARIGPQLSLRAS